MFYLRCNEDVYEILITKSSETLFQTIIGCIKVKSENNDLLEDLEISFVELETLQTVCT